MNVSVLFDYWVITIAALFVIVNPLTTAFMFVSLLPRTTEATRKAVAKRSSLIATAVFFVFALLGGLIFKIFGITIEAFRIAGGLILFGIAMSMIRKGLDEGETSNASEPGNDGKIARDISVIPLAIPFMSGPGAIATVMILTSEAPTTGHLILVFLAIILTTGSCYLAMVYSHFLVRYLGETGKEIITRIFGIILSVIAVQFVINGVLDIYTAL
ncbi:MULTISPECIES: MarC family protein [unclassified Methylophaga]|uniref:MarC family protein n=1 Tax=unclassified Methylophaga TaxID=2629249 RepID=UPI0010A90DF3|nr:MULTISPECIES: MarC family protein [unclassified Methylophaga]MDO8825361.1 MarC family protein [Methylophaga sp.]THK42041.1 NAAT family transporter [Methylophaga sp. SB9B]